MKFLALMMFLASSLALSHPAEPADLVDSASPACQEIASSVVNCQFLLENQVIAKESRGGYVCKRLNGSNCTSMSHKAWFHSPISCSAPMEDYLLCEISEIKKQTVDRLQRIKDVLTAKRFREILVQGHPVVLLYRYFKKKVEQQEIKEQLVEGL